jgi:hypothetical protein
MHVVLTACHIWHGSKKHTKQCRWKQGVPRLAKEADLDGVC